MTPQPPCYGLAPYPGNYTSKLLCYAGHIASCANALFRATMLDRLKKKKVAVITASKVPSELGGRDYSYFFFSAKPEYLRPVII